MDCRHIQIKEGRSPIELDQLLGLFETAAFWAKDRRREDLEIALEHSNPIVSAWDGDRTIGFARATSDGIYRAVIWDVVVHPNYQGAGIGRKLVQTILSHPLVSRVERVYLMTTNQQKFYERIGFQPNASTTLVLYNQEVEPLPSIVRSLSQPN